MSQGNWRDWIVSTTETRKPCGQAFEPQCIGGTTITPARGGLVIDSIHLCDIDITAYIPPKLMSVLSSIIQEDAGHDE